MKNKEKHKELTKEIKTKLDTLSNLQEQLLEPKEMIGASLIKRYLGTKEQKRLSYAFYLSTSQNRQTKLQHVSKNKVELVQANVLHWKVYQQQLKEWKRITKSLNQDFKELGNIQDQLKQESQENA